MPPPIENTPPINWRHLCRDIKKPSNSKKIFLLKHIFLLRSSRFIFSPNFKLVGDVDDLVEILIRFIFTQTENNFEKTNNSIIYNFVIVNQNFIFFIVVDLQWTYKLLSAGIRRFAQKPY